MKYLLLTDIPAPWREKVYEIVYNRLGDEFHVAYCNTNEKRRLWKFDWGDHSKTFLKTINIHLKGKKENFLNPGIIPFLLIHRPKVIICFSLVPTIFIAMFVAKLLGIKIITFADTWLGRDTNISKIQTVMRKLAYGIFPDAYLGASKQTLNMFKYYNHKVQDEQLYLSSLCADNEKFFNYLSGKEIKREFDIMFSGRIENEKNPLFFVDVAIRVKEKIGKCKVLIIGDGNQEIKEEIFNEFKKHNIEYSYPGFIKHDMLPEYYSKAKILLLPTSGDCWGVVINEAFASGVAVITTEMTAAAGELVLNNKNGYVLPMEAELWAEKVIELLTSVKLSNYSKCARETVTNFNFQRAAQGIVDAIHYIDHKGKKI